VRIGPTEIVAVGVALGAVARPLFRWLTAKTLAKRARPEDIPEIAKALHPQVELRRGAVDAQPKRSLEPGGDGTHPATGSSQ
jgi:hypothetical protein